MLHTMFKGNFCPICRPTPWLALMRDTVNNVSRQEIAAISIRAEVTAQADEIILFSGKSELFVQIKLLPKKMFQAINYVTPF